MRFAAPALASLLSFISAPCSSWGELGHQLVGELAQRQLTPEANAEVQKLLRNERAPTLSAVAMWADDLRASNPAQFEATSRWHYLNMGDGSCRFVPSRDCPDGACAIGAIEAQTRLLRDPSQPPEVRRDALKFIVHFVGDLHQPFHSTNRKDRGANDFQVSLRTDIPPENDQRDRYTNGVMGTNLHKVWDYYVLASAGSSLGEYAARLEAASRSPAPQGNLASWAKESCELIDRDSLYPKSHHMDSSYLTAKRPLAEHRVAQAANRLARLLNEALAPLKNVP
jgi:nuclease S1